MQRGFRLLLLHPLFQIFIFTLLVQIIFVASNEQINEQNENRQKTTAIISKHQRQSTRSIQINDRKLASNILKQNYTPPFPFSLELANASVWLSSISYCR